MRKHGFSDASFYIWRAKFGDLKGLEACWFKDLEMGNVRLKKLLAEEALEVVVTKEAVDIVVDHGISGLYVVRALARATLCRKYLKAARTEMP